MVPRTTASVGQICNMGKMLIQSVVNRANAMKVARQRRSEVQCLMKEGGASSLSEILKLLVVKDFPEIDHQVDNVAPAEEYR